MGMSFIAGAAATNVDLLYQNMPKIPGVGEEVYTDRFSLQLGGGLPATLINLGRLGVPARIATELGDDLFSAFAREEYIKNHVVPLNLYRGGKIPVNITSAILLEHDRSFVSYGKGSMEADDDAKEAFYRMATGAKICLMTAGAFVDVYRTLKTEGSMMVLDMGWDDDLCMKKYGDLLEIADYYTPNRLEAMKITGCADAQSAARALHGLFENVIVKVDRDGCLGIDKDGLFFSPSDQRFRAVDSTGAGDAFLAGLCYGLYHDYSFRDCVAFGNLTGGKAVTEVGALSGYLSETQLLEMKKTGKGEKTL